MDRVFARYCEEGNLIKAINIYKENQNIDIHVNNEFAFQCSYSCGHIGVAKWL
jgi:hypothetical protein